MHMRKFNLFCVNKHQHVPCGTQQDFNNGSEPWDESFYKSACAIVKYAEARHNWMYHKEEKTRTLCYICRNWYYLRIELSGWKGSVTYGLGADLSLPQCLSATTGIWTLTHKSDLRAEISGSIVRYGALAPRPEVLLSLYLVRACALSCNWSSYHIPGKNILLGSTRYKTLIMLFTRASLLNHVHTPVLWSCKVEIKLFAALPKAVLLNLLLIFLLQYQTYY